MRGSSKPVSLVPCLRNSHAERRVSLMLCITAFTFLVFTAPIAVNHVVHTLLLEEALHKMWSQRAFMTLFAISDLLAFMQHASQFYVCYSSSFCFRQALRRQFGRVRTRINRLLHLNKSLTPTPPLDEFQRRSHVPPINHMNNHMSSGNKRSKHATRNHFVASRQNEMLHLEQRAIHQPETIPRCETHVFLSVGQGLLMCRYCFKLQFLPHST